MPPQGLPPGASRRGRRPAGSEPAHAQPQHQPQVFEPGVQLLQAVDQFMPLRQALDVGRIGAGIGAGRTVQRAGLRGGETGR